MTKTLLDFDEIPLFPSPEQARRLLRLSTAHNIVMTLCAEQARLRLNGEAVALAALLGGENLPRQTPDEAATALTALPVLSDVPVGCVAYAIRSYQVLMTVQREQRLEELPAVPAPFLVAGAGLISRVAHSAVDVLGVGTVPMDPAGVPEHAWEALFGAQVAHFPATSWSLDVDPGQDLAYIHHVWRDGAMHWSVDLMV
ncbi:hypothetical protein [Deinococcus marmoris]|uniref:hypothetical protein n=1 Tax=Deinococcus marmoris TaxID=249408 RepID=UPI000496DCA6|nr:hypothetical protein [Deinococcus marmoris]